MNVLVHPQVRDFVRALHPDTRREILEAIRKLPRGDVKALSEPLDGYARLRIRHYRIILRFDGATVECLYGAPRSIVYETFRK